MKVLSLGGSGENGRNCFLLEGAQGNILLDCGVKREVVGGEVGQYPFLTREIVKRLSAVFLSHPHEDHSAALPLLAQLGYTGKIYASQPTIDAAPKLMAKWQSYVNSKQGQLPFSPDAAEKLHFEGLPLGRCSLGGISAHTGRSGHVLGGLWLLLELDGKKVFYSGDIALSPMLLQLDMPSGCDIAIVNCAYAGRTVNQQEQYDTLLRWADETIGAGGKLLLPVPPNGRGCDILIYLSKKLQDGVLYVDQEVLESVKQLRSQPAWASGWNADEINIPLIPIAADRQRLDICADGKPGVILTPDGMLTTPHGQLFFRELHTNASNALLVSGHVAKGTLAAALLEEDFREKHNVQMRVGGMVCKVHLDDNDLLMLNRHLQAKQMVLFHACAKRCRPVTLQLAKQGTQAVCLAPGQPLSQE